MRNQFSLLILLMLPILLWAQPPLKQQVEDDLGNVEDSFQEYFFEALKQRGIENYERSIEALRECLKIDSTKAELYFEIGKNYKDLDKYPEAEAALTKAISINSKNEWFLDELYDVYFIQGNIDKAMATVEKLVSYHPDYKQDLATLYLKKEDYEKALQLIDELDKELGPSDVRAAMRQEIYNSSDNSELSIRNLEKQIELNPKNESNYLNLIYILSESGNSLKAFETAEQLLKVQPESELAHLALYKFYIENDNAVEAVNSMSIVLQSTQIDAKSKTLVLNDYVNFVKQNPEYESSLVEITSKLDESSGSESDIELGYYYLKQGDKEKALERLKLALAENPNNFNLIRDVLLLEIDFENYEVAASQSSKALELFPAQPVLYLLNGVANNRIPEADVAIESLEMGLDFIIDDDKMEIDFYNELSLAYKQKNNISKSEAFAKKAKTLKQQ